MAVLPTLNRTTSIKKVASKNLPCKRDISSSSNHSLVKSPMSMTIWHTQINLETKSTPACSMLRLSWHWSRTIYIGSLSDKCWKRRTWQSLKISNNGSKCKRLVMRIWFKALMDSLTKKLFGESMRLSNNISSSMLFHRSRSVHQVRTNSANKSSGPMAQELFRCARAASKALS